LWLEAIIVMFVYFYSLVELSSYLSIDLIYKCILKILFCIYITVSVEKHGINTYCNATVISLEREKTYWSWTNAFLRGVEIY